MKMYPTLRVKRLTVCDNSGCNRAGKTCTVVRESLASIEIGEIVDIRFKDEFTTTTYRPYELKEKYFRDNFDAQRGRYTCVFHLLDNPRRSAKL